MKIGILTQPLQNNYGGLLQNYALQQVLKNLGHEPVTLDWDTKFKSISETNERIYEPKHMDSYMPFGKYQGKRIDELIEDDPKYVKWAMDNLNFSIDEECQEFLEEMLSVK